MAKKYLLYIHSEQFNNEPSKSGLVNKLLAEHYGTEPAPKAPPIIIKQPAAERLSNGLCKVHNTPLDSRGRCLMKGCKYN